MLIALLLLAALYQPAFAGDSDLLEAARRGRVKEVEAQLAGGAAIDAKDRDGRTALMLAAQYGRTAVVELLLAKGAKADTRDAHGWSAYMLALLSPSGGVIHTTHDPVLRLLPAPKRFRLQANAGWSPGATMFSSCFMRPAEMMAHMRDVRPDALVLEAIQRFSTTSGRDLIAFVRTDARGASEQSNLAPASDVDATLDLYVEPGAACVQGADRLTLMIRAQLSRRGESSPDLDKAFGTGVKTGMRTQSAINPNQHAPLYAAWARSQAGAIYWAAVEALLLHEW